MRYQRSVHCSLLGRPRDILMVDDVVFVSSYDHDSIFVLDRGTFDLVGAIRQPHMVHPRGLYAHNGRLYAACYGSPMGKVVVTSLSTFQEVSHFVVGAVDVLDDDVNDCEIHVVVNVDQVLWAKCGACP